MSEDAKWPAEVDVAEPSKVRRPRTVDIAVVSVAVAVTLVGLAVLAYGIAQAVR